MAKVIVKEIVLSKLDGLVDTLFDSKYFGTKESALAYVHNISDFIQSIPQQRHRPTINNKHGAWYAEYKPNRRTTWFVIFDKKGDRFVVRNLINNHTKDYPAFIKGL